MNTIPRDEIDLETDRILKSMSKEEIEEAQKEIAKLDPKLIEFLKKSAEKKYGYKFNEKPKKEFTDIELQKIQWMQPIKVEEKKKDKLSSFILKQRFDFKGNIITDDSNIPIHSGLYHHGEEPDRAGYTIDEIFQLLRSSVPGQRVINLQMLTNVIHNYKTNYPKQYYLGKF